MDPRKLALRFATKSDAEREDEEAERLVRKAPKDKPPRHDKRRERMEVKDPDVDGEDKDLSMNYKTIGGSERIAGDELVPVRLKSNPGQVVQVSKSTLQSDSGKYLPLEQKEESESGSVGAPTESASSPSGAKDYGKIQQTLKEMSSTDPEFASLLKDFGKPGTDIFEWAKASPDTPVAQFLRGRTPPKGVETMGDLQQAMMFKGPEKPSTPTEEPQPGATPPTQSKKPKKAPKPQAAPEAPGYPKRSASEAEWEESRFLLTQTFPAEIAADLLLVRPKIHPDEVKSLVGDYLVAKELPVKASDIDGVRESASKFYTTDPGQVAPPRTVIREGEEMSFDDLDPEDQDTALRQHQIQTLAMSMAARNALSKAIESQGAPRELSEKLSAFMLTGKEDTPELNQKRASQAAEEIFYQGLEEADKTKITAPDTVRSVLSSLSDPGAKRVAVGYFQAQDYNQARKTFLDPQSDSHFTERDNPRIIASRMGKAMNFLWDRSEQYPEGMAKDLASTFRARVMRHLGALAPDKHPQVAELLDEVDHKHYDRALKRFEKAKKAYQKEKTRIEKEYSKDYEDYSARLKSGEEVDPPLSSNDRLASEGIYQPIEPAKPPRYDVARKTPEQLSQSASDMWDRFNSRMAKKIATRASSMLFSTYLNTQTMDQKRQAVYWGVDPDSVEAYPDWSQPHVCDLSESDFSRLVNSAKKWLGTPVLSQNIEGIQRDAQLRAALDLAVRDEGYEASLHPGVYDNLLARLAGKSASEQTTVRNVMSKKIELETAAADRVLSRLDRIASTVQENHEKWGLPFEIARDLVNEIDRTADEMEKAAYGEDSMTVRQEQVLKQAKVLEREADEPYMDTFSNPMKPHQTEADEPYMQAYGDDQSSAVHDGRAENGRPLT